MEADWEFEVGGDAPVIDACWPGFVDLRWGAKDERDLAIRIGGFPEVAQFSALGAVLVTLNSRQSPVWTSKCDFWPALQTENFDPDELDVPAGCVGHVLGCYIDLLPGSDEQWLTPPMVEADCRTLCDRLRTVPLRWCRADLIIREAMIVPGAMSTGITAYFTAGGATPATATRTLESALAAFADALLATRRYNEKARASSSIG